MGRQFCYKCKGKGAIEVYSNKINKLIIKKCKLCNGTGFRDYFYL